VTPLPLWARRTIAMTVALAWVGAVSLVALACLSGCGASQRDRTIHATYTAVSAARDGFVAYDRIEQASIVTKATSEESGKAQLAAYRASRAKVVEAFEGAFHALAAAALLNDDQSVSAMLLAAAQLAEIVKPFLEPGAKP